MVGWQVDGWQCGSGSSGRVAVAVAGWQLQWQGGSGRVAVDVAKIVVAGVGEWEIGEMGWHRGSGRVAMAGWQ
jgi:hypothetical protein